MEDIRARLGTVESLLARIPLDILATTTDHLDIKGESDVENDNDGEGAAIGALEELALGQNRIGIVFDSKLRSISQ